VPRRQRRIRDLVAAIALAMAGSASAQQPRMMAADASNLPAIPAQDESGAFRTINYGIDASEALWHVRAALNVAALGCEGAPRAALIAAYNRFITAQRVPLAAANKAIGVRLQARYGAGWTAQYDADMTALYNFFSQPFAKTAFCAVAAPVAAETARVTPATAGRFAADALPRLEAPFTAFYARYLSYQRALADYRSRYTGGATAAAPLRAAPSLDYALDAASPPLVPAPAPSTPPRSGLSPAAYTRLLLAAMQDRTMPVPVRTAAESATTAAPAPALPALSYQLPN